MYICWFNYVSLNQCSPEGFTQFSATARQLLTTQLFNKGVNAPLPACYARVS
jgi:hypothetical protein